MKQKQTVVTAVKDRAASESPGDVLSISPVTLRGLKTPMAGLVNTDLTLKTL